MALPVSLHFPTSPISNFPHNLLQSIHISRFAARSLNSQDTMKKSGFVAASVAAATAYSASSSKSTIPHEEAAVSSKNKEKSSSQTSSSSSSSSEKFAPRFDGLRFIETLVTAHR